MSKHTYNKHSIGIYLQADILGLMYWLPSSYNWFNRNVEQMWYLNVQMS